MNIICVLLIAAFFVCNVTPRCDNRPHRCLYSDSTFTAEAASRSCYGEHLCNCTNTTADCSSNNGNLTFVPDVGQSYLHLNLSNNNITSISDLDFFQNVSREVLAIDLYNNGLSFIKEGVFEGLDKLDTLLLGGSNILGFKDLQWLQNLPNLINVSLGCLNVGPMLNMSWFQPFHNLTSLFLWKNKIFQLHEAHFPSLTTLNLNRNRMYEFPKTCLSPNTSLFPHLKHLYLKYNMIQCIKDPVCLPNLRSLYLNYNNFMYFAKDLFSETRFSKLKTLELVQMENKIFTVKRFFINNSAIVRFNFMLNQIHFSRADDNVFGGCTNVQTLHLGDNDFRDVSVKKFRSFFRPMKGSLEVLNLGGAQLKHISPAMFEGLNLKALDLYRNALTSIPDGTFDSLRRLSKLKMNSNRIATISATTFGAGLRLKLRQLSLSDNPFQCTCDILWFQQWMKSNPLLFQDNPYTALGYRCANMVNITIPSFVLNPQACLLGSDAVAFTIAVTCVLLFFLLLLTILFRFRWHARLWLYQVCRSGRRGRRSRRYKYDVFVSYAEEDARWVLQELLPVTEGRWGLNLCLHQRDFRPGKHIVDNIADSVSDSERVVLVFSPHFARSEWCQFELKLCQSVVMERDDVMVLVALQETRSRDMSGAMLAVLRTTTYIEWEDGQDARQAFWGRLRLALEDPDEIHVV